MARSPKKPKKERPHFVWNTYGDWIATLVDDHMWDQRGLRIAWVDGEDVFRSDGEWLGRLSRDSRIIRKRTEIRHALRDDIPPPPPKPDLPARATLPPAFAELPFSEIDVVEEDPSIFKKLSDLKPDMD